jgi:hypothetical protein
MTFPRILMAAILLGAFSIPGAQALHLHRKPTSGHSSKSSRKSRHAPAKPRGQQAIDSARATQIQTALVREHYMSGAPTGAWDDQSRDAMARYQAANGWQTKVIPDSRALIKLGLGPEGGAAVPVASAAGAPGPAFRAASPAPIAPVSPSTAGGHPATLGSAITAHNNTQNLVDPE